MMKYELDQEVDGKLVLLRELQPNEERFYVNEPERLQSKHGKLWLRVKSGEAAELREEKERLECYYVRTQEQQVGNGGEAL